MRIGCTLAVLVVVMAVGSVARAGDVSTAREHFERGRTLYDLQRYVEAAKEYEAAFEMTADPALLFNLAQAYRGAKDYEKALGFYRAYLRRVPDAANRAFVEARIRDLQPLVPQPVPPPPVAREAAPGALASPAPSASPGPTAAAPPVAAATPSVSAAAAPRVRSRRMMYAGIATAAVGAALLAGGIGFAVAARSANDEIAHPRDNYVFNPDTESRLKTFQALEVPLLVVGGAAIVAGGVVAVLGARKSRGL